MMSMNGVTVNNCDLPDEYIDPVISFDDAEGTGENENHHAPADDGAMTRESSLHLISPLQWLRKSSTAQGVFKRRANSDHDMKLCDYDLPDEYVDAAVLSFDDSPTNYREGTLPLPSSPRELLGCMNHCHDSKEPSFEDRNDTADLALSDCDLPDGYISAEVCNSPRESPHKIVSYDQPTVGLSRRHREYPSDSSSTNTTSSSTTSIHTNDLTYRISDNNTQKATDKASSSMVAAMEEMIPEMKEAPSNGTLLRKRKLSKTSTTE